MPQREVWNIVAVSPADWVAVVRELSDHVVEELEQLAEYRRGTSLLRGGMKSCDKIIAGKSIFKVLPAHGTHQCETYAIIDYIIKSRLWLAMTSEAHGNEHLGTNRYFGCIFPLPGPSEEIQALNIRGFGL